MSAARRCHSSPPAGVPVPARTVPTAHSHELGGSDESAFSVPFWPWEIIPFQPEIAGRTVPLSGTNEAKAKGVGNVRKIVGEIQNE